MKIERVIAIGQVGVELVKQRFSADIFRAQLQKLIFPYTIGGNSL